MKEILAPKLALGQTIGLISPASPGKEDVLKLGLHTLETLGFKVKVGQHAFARNGYLAGTDRDRADDLNAMFADPEVDAIFCARGGYGTPRILPLLDYEAIAANPKVFVGYSDITALHLAISQRTGLVTFHGPMVGSDFGQEHFEEYTWPRLQKAIMQDQPIGPITWPNHYPAPECIKPGSAEGELVGGNLSLIAATMGTPYQMDPRGKIILIEEVGELPYRVDRMLTQLELAGFWQQACGIVFGESVRCEPPAGQHPTLIELLREKLSHLSIPVLYGLPLGHGHDRATVPMGVRAKLIADEGFLSIEEAAVRT